MKKSIKWWIVFFGIGCLFLVGMAFLCKFADSAGLENSGADMLALKSTKEQNSSDTDGMNELSKKELERESAKSEIINIENDKSDKNDKVDKSDKKDNLEKDIKEVSSETKSNKLYDFSDWNKKCPMEMKVINKDNPIPENMNFKTKVCRGKEINAVAYEDLNLMISDAKKDGILLWISSGYRDMNLQTKLFNRRTEREKSKDIISDEEAAKRAAKVVAKPGTSEHNTGLAVDFNGVEDNFYKTKEYKWLMDNAHKYGFIERYQKKWKDCTGIIYEPWHFRYVGKEYASKIKESGLCLEKYVVDYLIKK